MMPFVESIQRSFSTNVPSMAKRQFVNLISMFDEIMDVGDC